MKGITYYKLRSPYSEDRTKNCGLTGEEIDNNFFNLKTEDIKDAYWDDINKVLVLERVDGSKININGIVDGLDEFSFSYDPDEGVLHISAAGHIFEVEGFTTPDMINEIYTDNSIRGKGTLENPLTLSPIVRTGVYRPAIKLLDIINGDKLPTPYQINKGDRYVTLERISDYGLLYNFNGVKRIANDLRCQSSEWRIPTKEDWDDMLNAIEPCSEYRNHNSTSSNRALGQIAGKLLKATSHWTLECEGCNTLCQPVISYPEKCDEPSSDVNPTPNKGIDAFGFKVMPAGYGDGGNVMDYFSQRAVFWTSSQLSITDIYTKRFDYNKSTVYQEAVGPNMLLSLRLVKDFNGNNYNERETINGCDYFCILMPDINGKSKIWTIDNVYFSNAQYCGVEPNSGYSLTYQEKYFINEWSGFGWVKHELKENESIILKLGPNGIKNQEWRVVDGNLESIPDMIYNEVVTTISEDIKTLDEKLTNEIERSIAADNKLSTDLANESERAKEAENTIATNLANEVERAKEAENTIATNLANESERAKEAENTIATDLANESERAKEAENTIDAKLNEEIKIRFDNDIKIDEEYIFKVNKGIILFTNNGNNITIKVDGDYGTI